MKKFTESLREHAKCTIDFEKGKMLLVIKEEWKTHQSANVCYICGKRILKKLSKSINCWKVRDYCHYTCKYKGEAHSICNSRFNVPNKFHVVYHNGSNYDYHFIVKRISNKVYGRI